MCLSVPGKITRIDENMNMAEVDVGGFLRDISLDLCPDVSLGDYVLIHAGFAIQKIDEDEAKETFNFLRKMVGTT
jgi:hydrogenase expression/formation protein HypC